MHERLQDAVRLTRRLDPAKPGEMSQVSGGEVQLVDVGGDRLIELVDVGGDRLIESVEVAA